MRRASVRFNSILFCVFLILGGFRAQAGVPENDDCSNASNLPVGASCTMGTNLGATSEAYDNYGNCAFDLTHTVWYKFVTPGAASDPTRNYTISTDNGNNYLASDTRFVLFKG